MKVAQPHLALSDRQGLRALLFYTFLMVLGFTMLMPLVAVHFVSNVGMSSATVGIALAVRQLTQQGLTVAGGLLSDKLGAKPMICAGVLVRALGFAALAWAGDPLLLILALVISALGGALFEAPYQATIVALTDDTNRRHYYLVSNWVSGIASTIGPLIGIALLQFDFQSVCYGAAACFFVNYLISLFFLPRVTTPGATQAPAANLKGVLHDRRFVFFTGLMGGYWFTSVQVNISFPLWAEKLSGIQESVGIMYAVSAAITVALQYPLVKLAERRFDTREILTIGVVTMALSLGAIGFVEQFYAFLICVVFFTLGVLLTRPTQQTITAALADGKSLGTYLGFSSLGLAVGGGLGNAIGGLLIDIAKTQQLLMLPWLVYCAVGLLSAAGLYWLTGTTASDKTNLLSQTQ
ncbi:MFS transporter [Exilibacterium tricleocarpae]|uniref:MFS transporter n=1 Tax=Exilibacterium tricleocarpae TaxID=2591008 RepID=A0A545T057_9GAMM|nr:MFS transporter [Exilibacterium tricleocarpae]TQV70571.1 MFS transporter [Exilibacterium tricleocarpae]